MDKGTKAGREGQGGLPWGLVCQDKLYDPAGGNPGTERKRQLTSCPPCGRFACTDISNSHFSVGFSIIQSCSFIKTVQTKLIKGSSLTRLLIICNVPLKRAASISWWKEKFNCNCNLLIVSVNHNMKTRYFS